MNKRILLAGVIAGVVVFAWEAVAHMMTPLGEAGLKRIPNEAAVIETMRTTMTDSGFFMFPAPEVKPGMSSAEKKQAMDAAMQKAKAGPSGLLLFFRRNGYGELAPSQFATQLLCDIVVMCLAGWLLASLSTGASFAGRWIPVLAMGLFSVLRSDIPMWNWLGFPRQYIGAQVAIDLIGFALGGFVLAKMVNGKSKGSAASV